VISRSDNNNTKISNLNTDTKYRYDVFLRTSKRRCTVTVRWKFDYSESLKTHHQAP
jgi:hypothetical protein